MKRNRNSEDESQKKQKMALVQAQEVDVPEEVDTDFPELEAKIEALAPELEAAVIARNIAEVERIIQEYDDYVDETYSEHPYYNITPAIQVSLQHLGNLANSMGFDEIANIFGYEDDEEADDEEVDADFPELEAKIKTLSPELEIAVKAGDAGRVREIIEQYDAHVDATYSEHPHYDMALGIEIYLPHLAPMAHSLEFHEICNSFEYEDCPLFGAELAVEAQ